MIPLVNPAAYMPSLARVADYYADSLAVGQLSNFGPCWYEAVKRIEALTGRHAVPVSSGTAALQIALELFEAETVCVPEFTFIATELAARRRGCVDHAACDPETWLPRMGKLLQRGDGSWLTCKPDILVVVAPFGYRCDFEYWDDYGARENIQIVYDLAGAWGMKIETKNPCAISFHATKNLPIGEGGVVLCEREQWDDARRLSNFDFDEDRVPRSDRGLNAKMDELHAAMLLAQLDQHDRVLARIEAKRELLNHYFDALPNILVPHSRHLGNAAPSLCAARVHHSPPYHSANMSQRIVDEGARAGFVARRGYWPNVGGGGSIDDVICLPSDIVPGGADFKLVVDAIRKGFA